MSSLQAMAIQYAEKKGKENVELIKGKFQKKDQIIGNVELNLTIPGFLMEPDDYIKGYVSITGKVESISNGKAELIVVTSSMKDVPDKLNLFEDCEYHKIQSI